MTLPTVCSYTQIHVFMHLSDGDPEGNEDFGKWFLEISEHLVYNFM